MMTRVQKSMKTEKRATSNVTIPSIARCIQNTFHFLENGLLAIFL